MVSALRVGWRAKAGAPARRGRAAAAVAASPRAARVAGHAASWFAVGVPTLAVLSRGWTPVGDDAAIAVRAHQVLSLHPPLVGYGTTTATAAGVPLHDLGPLMFWLLALPVRIDPLHGVLWGAALACGIALSVAVEAAWSTGKWFACLLVGLAALDYFWLFPEVTGNLTWNAYFPIPFLVASVVLAWVVATSSLAWWPALVATASVAAQAHLVAAPVAGLLVVVAPVVAVADRGRPGSYRWCRWGAAVGAVCWIAPLAQELGAHGNLSALATDHQAHLGPSFGLRAVAYAGAPPPLWLHHAPAAFLAVAESIGANSPPVGAAVLVALAAIGVVAWRSGRRSLADLAFVAVATAVGFLVAFALIPRKNLLNVDYVMDMLWVLSMLAWVVAGWGAVALLARWRPQLVGSSRARRSAALAGVAATVVLALVAAVGFDPGSDSGDGVPAVAATATMTAVVQRTAPVGPVAVYVAALDHDELSAIELGDAVAWHLLADGRRVGTLGLTETSTDLAPAPGSSLFLLIVDHDRLVAVGSRRCPVVDDACLRFLSEQLYDRYR